MKQRKISLTYPFPIKDVTNVSSLAIYCRELELHAVPHNAVFTSSLDRWHDRITNKIIPDPRYYRMCFKPSAIQFKHTPKKQFISHVMKGVKRGKHH
jgi:hypothetical protein